jgi:hypothetical protein
MRPGISIVIPTVARASLVRAVQSVYAQKYDGELQLLVGLDADVTGQAAAIREQLEGARPAHARLDWIDLGYSTSVRHGGVHSCTFGGSLRSALTFLAKHRLVMYLDDDDWLDEIHCHDIVSSIADKPWAYSYCYYADGNEGKPLCVDFLESVGPGKGMYKESHGGFVRPSGMLIDKLHVSHLLHLWSHSPSPEGGCEDRLVFDHLKQMPHAFTGFASVYYTLDPKDSGHPARLRFIEQCTGKSVALPPKTDSVR